MTAKQQRFCEEYLIDLNATRAAIRAGYSPKSAKTNGPRLLENAGIRARVEAMMARLSRRTGVSAERVVRELRASPLPACRTWWTCARRRSSLRHRR